MGFFDRDEATSTRDTACQHSCPPRVDFMSLPTEIFEEIIRILCDDSREEIGRQRMDLLIARLSLVSREFRQAVLNTEAFWTRVNDMYCVRTGFEERLERSKGEPLSVHIDLGRRGLLHQLMRKGLLRMLPVAHRWREFSTRISGNATRLADDYPHREFLNLQYLHLEFHPQEGSDKLFQQWRFTNLVVLELVDAIPPPCLFSKLIVFRLDTIHAYSHLEDGLLDRLVCFLQSTPHLKHLSLKLSYCSLPYPGTLQTACLPNLTEFVLSNYDRSICGVDWEMRHGTGHLCQILSSLVMPMVEDLHLYLYFVNEQRLFDWFEYAASAPRSLGAVTSLSVASEFKVESQSFERLLSPFSNVGKLELDLPEMRDTISGMVEMRKFEQLRALVFSGWERGQGNGWDRKEEARRFVQDALHVDLVISDAPLNNPAGLVKWMDRDPWA